MLNEIVEALFQEWLQSNTIIEIGSDVDRIDFLQRVADFYVLQGCQESEFVREFYKGVFLTNEIERRRKARGSGGA